MRGIQHPWPSESLLWEFVRKSEGSFIFAATLFEFIVDGRGSPQRKLEAALTSSIGLDSLYKQVFGEALGHDSFDKVVGSLLTLKESLSIIDFGALLQLKTSDVVHALLGIQSILQIPEDDNKPVRFLHASLGDFLRDRTRSESYWINPPMRNMQIASDCLQYLAGNLPEQDFYGGTTQEYACSHWIDHVQIALTDAGGDDSVFSILRGPGLMNCLTSFISGSLIRWMNTLLFITDVDDISEALDKLTLDLKVSHRL